MTLVGWPSRLPLGAKEVLSSSNASLMRARASNRGSLVSEVTAQPTATTTTAIKSCLTNVSTGAQFFRRGTVRQFFSQAILAEQDLSRTFGSKVTKNKVNIKKID